MARYLIQFESRALPGQDDTYNRWYEDVHVPDVLALPGFLSCKRYRILAAEEAVPRYIAAYEVESDDPQATLAGLFAAAKDMAVSPALDPDNVAVAILEPRLP